MKHPFLSDTSCVLRLVNEYRRYGKLVVAYDFDNTVYDYHSKGHDYSEVVELLREAAKLQMHLIVFTAEKDFTKVTSFLTLNDIPYDSINENPPFFKSDARKIYFNILLDDRAGLKSAFEQLTEVIEILKNNIQ